MFSILLGSRDSKKPLLTSIPSTMYRGLELPKLPLPRMLRDVPPGREIIVTPGTEPCSVFTMFDEGRLSSFLLSTEATAPVRFVFF